MNQIQKLAVAHTAATAVWTKVAEICWVCLDSLGAESASLGRLQAGWKRLDKTGKTIGELLEALRLAVAKAEPLLQTVLSQFSLAAGREGFEPPSEIKFRYSSCHTAILGVSRSVLDRAESPDLEHELFEFFADLRFIEWPYPQGLQHEYAEALRQLEAPEKLTEGKVEAIARRVVSQERLRDCQPQVEELHCPADYVGNKDASRILKVLLGAGSTTAISKLKKEGKILSVFRGTRSCGVKRASLMAHLVDCGIEDPGEGIDKILATDA